MSNVTLSAAQVAALEFAKGVVGFAQSLAVADAAYEAVIPRVASDVAKLLGVKPSFVQWEAVAEQFQASYAAKKGCVAETARNRWFAVCKHMADNFALAKPAKPSEAGTKKAKERAALDKKIKAAKAQFVKPADAIQKAQELIAEGKVAEAKVVQAAAHELFKQVADDAKKQSGDKLKKLRDEAKAAILGCVDISLLQAALEVLRNGKEASAAAASKPKSRVARQPKAPA